MCQIVWRKKTLESYLKSNINLIVTYRCFLDGSRTIAPEENYPPDNCPLDDCSPDNCHQGKLPRGKLSPRHKISSKNYCPHLSNSSQRVLRENWKLCIVYKCNNWRIILLKVIFQGCNLGVKSDLLQYIFYRF